MVPALVAAATGEAMPADEFLMDMLPPPMRGNAPIHVQLPVGIGHSNGYTVIDTSGCGGAYRRSAYLDDFEAASASASSNGNGDGGRSGASGAGRRR